MYFRTKTSDKLNSKAFELHLHLYCPFYSIPHPKAMGQVENIRELFVSCRVELRCVRQGLSCIRQFTVSGYCNSRITTQAYKCQKIS